MNTSIKKYAVLFLAVMALQLGAEAQMRQKTEETPSICLGVKGGVNLSRMLYWHNPALNEFPKDTLCLIGGLFAEVPLGKVMMFAPEVMYVQRGVQLDYQHHSGAEVHYGLLVNYVDLRLPVELRWPILPFLQPYMVVGAEGGVRLGGHIGLTRSAPAFMSDVIDVGNANMALLHAGVFVGAGLRSRIDLGGGGLVLKLSATYHQGVLDTYSAMEKDGTAEAENVNVYEVTGERLPRGIELCLGIAIPLVRSQRDACSTFANDHYRPKHSKGTLYGF